MIGSLGCSSSRSSNTMLPWFGPFSFGETDAVRLGYFSPFLACLLHLLSISIFLRPFFPPERGRRNKEFLFPYLTSFSFHFFFFIFISRLLAHFILRRVYWFHCRVEWGEGERERGLETSLSIVFCVYRTVIIIWGIWELLGTRWDLVKRLATKGVEHTEIVSVTM